MNRAWNWLLSTEFLWMYCGDQALCWLSVPNELLVETGQIITTDARFATWKIRDFTEDNQDLLVFNKEACEQLRSTSRLGLMGKSLSEFMEKSVACFDTTRTDQARHIVLGLLFGVPEDDIANFACERPVRTFLMRPDWTSPLRRRFKADFAPFSPTRTFITYVHAGNHGQKTALAARLFALKEQLLADLSCQPPGRS